MRTDDAVHAWDAWLCTQKNVHESVYNDPDQTTLSQCSEVADAAEPDSEQGFIREQSETAVVIEPGELDINQDQTATSLISDTADVVEADDANDAAIREEIRVAGPILLAFWACDRPFQNEAIHLYNKLMSGSLDEDDQIDTITLLSEILFPSIAEPMVIDTEDIGGITNQEESSLVEMLPGNSNKHVGRKDVVAVSNSESGEG